MYFANFRSCMHVALTLSARLAGVLLLGTLASDALAADAMAPQKPVYVCQMASHAHMAGQPVAEYDKPGICPTDGMELIDKNKRLRVALLVFNGVQDIDFAGPLEVFGQSGATVFTVASSTDNIQTVFGLNLKPDYDLDHAPQADIVVVPGGNVSSILHSPKALDWVRARALDSRAVMSVCTGAFIMGKAGLLDGQLATTIVGAQGQLATAFPNAKVVTDRRYTDNGKIVTTGGLSSGIDGALHMVDRELGRLRAEDIARGLEYTWRPEGQAPFGQLAGNVMPDLSEFVPKGALWERLVDRGDMSKWDVTGRIELQDGTAAFLDDGAVRMRKAGWHEMPSAGKLARHYAKTTNGKIWQVAMTVKKTDEPAIYTLSVAIRQAGGARSIASK